MTKYTHAFLKLGRNKIYPIVEIHSGTNQVTLAEKVNVWNTVSLENVELLTENDLIQRKGIEL